MDKHLEVCSKRSQLTKNDITNSRTNDLHISSERLSVMEEDLKYLRKALNEEIQMRHTLIGDLGSLKRRNQVNSNCQRERHDLHANFIFVDYRRMDR